MAKSLSQTPAPKKDRIVGSKVNPKGSASSEKSAEQIKLSTSIIVSLTKKLNEFKETHKTNKVSLSDLKAVYRRGLGAYSSSHRPTISGGKPNTRNAWAMARVNAFLRKAGGGEHKKAYVQDDDLMNYAKGGKLDVVKEEKRLGVLSIYETHNYLKNKFKSYKKKNAELDDLPNIFIRAGLPKIKKDGTFDVSMNYYLGKKERGVSVFDAKYSPNSDFIFIDFNRGASGSDTSIYMTYSNSQFDIEDDGNYESYLGKMYLLEGDFVGYGGDGEYLLNPKTLKVIGLLNPNKVVPPKSFLKEYLGGMNIYFGGERFEKYPKYADGGDVGQEIKCRRCGWNWNTKDSEEFDKYVCHNCGFDNRTFYDVDPIGYEKGGEVGGIKYTIAKGKDPEDRIVKFEEGSFGNYEVEGHEALFIKSWSRNGGNGWSYKKGIQTYPTIKMAILNYLQNKRSGKFADGGDVDDKKKIYAKWKSLVNMSYGEIKKFYDSKEGKEAGLSSSEAKEQGINSGRESARMLMKMKTTPKDKWSDEMWKWANKQISFISRMSGMQGELYDDKGNKTRKHTSLLIWGHNPKKSSSMKYENGDIIDEMNLFDRFGNKLEIGDKVKYDKVFYTFKYRIIGTIIEFKEESDRQIKNSSFGKIPSKNLNIRAKVEISEKLDNNYRKVKDFQKTTLIRLSNLNKIDEQGNDIIPNQNQMADGGEIEYLVEYEVFVDDAEDPYTDNRTKTFKDLDEAIDFGKRNYASVGYEIIKDGEVVEYGYVDTKNKRLSKYADGGVADNFKIGDSVIVIGDDRYGASIKKINDLRALVSFKNGSEKDVLFKDLVLFKPTNIDLRNKLQSEIDEIERWLYENEGYESESKVKAKQKKLTELENKIEPIWLKNKAEEDKEVKKLKDKTAKLDKAKEIANRKYNSVWDSVKNKFSEVFFEEEDSTNPNEIYSNQVKAREYKFMFDRYSEYDSSLSWQDAENKFLDMLTSEEKSIIKIEHNIKNVHEVFGVMWEKKILVKRIKYVDGGEMDVLMQDTVQRMDNPNFADISYYKKGGELNPDDPKIKNEVVHKSGKVGGMLVGNRHSEGGIKAINKSTGQPLEMEGGEVVITRNAVSDEKKRLFEGEMLTNRQILSKINQSGGGVSFAKGGKVDNDDCGCNHYDAGGKITKDKRVISKMMKLYPQDFNKGVNEETREHRDTFKSFKEGKINLKETVKMVVAKHLQEKPNYYKNYNLGGYLNLSNLKVPSLKEFMNLGYSIISPFENDDSIYMMLPDSENNDEKYYKHGDKKANKISNLLAYETYLYDNFGILFSQLPIKVKNGLTLGKQSLIDNYINS